MRKEMKIFIGIMAVIAAIVLVANGNGPEFFDIFGLVVFIFLIYLGWKMLISKKKLSDWMGFAVFLIGILGVIVDGSMVIKTYFLGG